MKNLPRLAVALAASLGLATSAFAGTAMTSNYKGDYKSDKEMPASCEPDPLTLVHVTSDYDFESDLDRGHGKLDTWHNGVDLQQRIPLNNFTSWPNVQCGKWYLRAGADYERFDFDVEHESRLPNTLQSISGIIALEYLVKGDTGILIESRPGVYFEHDINSGAFDFPTNIGAAIPIFGGDKFYLIAGVSFSLLRSYPVLPIVGVLWHINPKWDLKGYLPEPRLIYKASDKLELWAGGELAGGGYKTDDRNVKPDKLSGAVVTYSDVRAGAGLTYKMKPFTVDLGAGYSIQREFDYDRAGERFRTDPSPYVKLALKAEF
jgi:hypothetical protein